VFAIASDGAGGVYVAGTTRFLLPFPGITPGSADPIYGGDTNTTEAFVARLDAGLTTLLSATYIGGGSWETVYALAVDAAGTVFVAGRTDSSDFPGVGPGSADSTFAGTSEAFVARLDPTLSVLQVATYLGGDSIDGALALDIDAAGMLYVGGNTHSSNFPGVTVASSDPTFSGVRDGFVARLDPSLIVPPVATYVSGTGCDSVSAVAVDGSGVYVAGTTQSSDFPGISLASADFSFSGTDAYVVRLDPMLTLPPVATYVGGTEDGGASSLALGNGSVYVAGLTASTDFPGVGPGSADSDQHDLEGFIARLTPDLGSVMAATLLGGETWDWVNDIAIGVLGTVVVAGGTRSGFAFPTPGGWAAGCNGSVSREDAMFGTVSSDLSTVSSLMCVRHSDALGLAVDGPSIFIGGTTSSDTWLHPDQVEPTAADPEFGGQREGFVVRLGSPFFSVTWSQLLAALKESLMLCRCLNGRDERALVRTLDKAGEQFTRDNHHAAIAALNQVVRVIERLVRSGDMSVDDGRRFIAQANEIIGAMRPVPSRAPVRPRDIRSIPRVFAESCACDTFVRASGAEGGFSGGPISCPALPPRGAEPRR
jgi:hypothetical protein